MLSNWWEKKRKGSSHPVCPKINLRPWLSRIDYYENNKQIPSSHLELLISEKNWLFSGITSSRWQEEITQAAIFHNRHRWSGPYIGDAGHEVFKSNNEVGNDDYRPR